MMQVEAYSLMTEPILDALRFFSSFGYDVLTYTIVDRLASGRSKLKEDGLHFSDWLQVIVHPCCDTSSLCLRLCT
jgi:THO complex subunit 2